MHNMRRVFLHKDEGSLVFNDQAVLGKQRGLQHAYIRAADTFVPSDDLKHTQLSLVNQKRDRYHLPLLFN